jgi:hypothetical protein
VSQRPPIVCLCGSTRFWQAFQQQNINETLAGKIVLSIAPFNQHDDITFSDLSQLDKEAITTQLNMLHQHKIDLADEVLILNMNGYIGESTQREIDYARSKNKLIRFLETR